MSRKPLALKGAGNFLDKSREEIFIQLPEGAFSAAAKALVKTVSRISVHAQGLRENSSVDIALDDPQWGAGIGLYLKDLRLFERFIRGWTIKPSQRKNAKPDVTPR